MAVELVSFADKGFICRPTTEWVHPVHDTKFIPFNGDFALRLPTMKAEVRPGQELTKTLMKTYGIMGANNSGPGCSVMRFVRELVPANGVESTCMDEHGFWLSGRSNSGLLGVTKKTNGNSVKFVAKLGTQHLGTYDTAEEAAAVRSSYGTPPRTRVTVDKKNEDGLYCSLHSSTGYVGVEIVSDTRFRAVYAKHVIGVFDSAVAAASAYAKFRDSRRKRARES